MTKIDISEKEHNITCIILKMYKTLYFVYFTHIIVIRHR